MYQNDAISQNTIHVNDMLVRIFKLMLVAIAAIVILKASGKILLPWPFLIISAGVGSAVCILPIACRHFAMDGNMIKYMNIYCAAAFSIFGYFYLNMGVIMLLVIPIGLACLYFDIKLIRHSSALSVLGLILGEFLDGGVSWAFTDTFQGINIEMAVYFVQFGIIAALLIAVSKRAMNILSNTHSYYENIDNIFSNVHASSKSLEAAEDILLQGISALEVNNEEDASASNNTVKGIISNINKSMENAREIIKSTQTMFKSKNKDLKAGDEIARIEEYSRNSRELVSKLANYTDKINEDLRLISVMIDESKLLSVNAAAEAESASSGGRGSAIIAMKVQKLSDESIESATHIQELLNSVVNDAENTVKSVADTYQEVFKSLELINRTVETLIKWLMYKNMK
jgi:hypothetical protein